MTTRTNPTETNTVQAYAAQFFQANSQLDAWVAGTQALTLLAAAHDAGWLRLLSEPREVASLAELTGLPPEHLEDVLAALEAHGVTRQEGGRVRLNGPFAALYADDAPISLGEVLAGAQQKVHLVGAALRPGPADLTPDQALVRAQAIAGRTTALSQALFKQVFDEAAEYGEVLEAGGRQLDVGCGVAHATLSLSVLYPAAHTVGLEIIPEVAAEATYRAQKLGVADRVDIRCLDARDFDEASSFDVSFWAQPFFSWESRAPTLAMIRRALKPGGILLMQELFPAPNDEAAERAFALNRLVYGRWGVPFGPSAEELSAEGAAAGLEPLRIVNTIVGRLVLMRRS